MSTIGIGSKWASLNVANHISTYSKGLEKSVARITTGMRINTAADDPAGLTISEKNINRIGALDQAAQNAQNDSAVLKVADNAYSEIVDTLQRMRELATQASDPNMETEGRAGLNEEYTILNSRLNDILTNTKYGSINIFADNSSSNQPDFSNGFAFLLGADAGTSFTAGVPSDNLPVSVGDPSEITAFSDSTTASTGLANLDTALTNALAGQALIGGWENAIGFITEGLQSESTALQSAQNDAFDADVAREMTQYVKNSVQLQASQLILSQHNQNAYAVLNLLN